MYILYFTDHTIFCLHFCSRHLKVNYRYRQGYSAVYINGRTKALWVEFYYFKKLLQDLILSNSKNKLSREIFIDEFNRYSKDIRTVSGCLEYHFTQGLPHCYLKYKKHPINAIKIYGVKILLRENLETEKQEGKWWSK